MALAMNKGCHDVGMRTQHLGYRNICVCWRIKLFFMFWGIVLCWYWQCLLGWKLSATYCNTIRRYHCGMLM